MVYEGRLCIKGVHFSGFYMKGHERVRISLVEVYERVGKSVLLVCKKAQKLAIINRCILCLAVKKLKKCNLFIFQRS